MGGVAYQPGSTLLHQAPVAAKLLGLTAVTIILTTVDGVPADTLGLVTALAAHRAAGLPWRRLWRTVRPVLWVMVPLAAWTVWVRGWTAALSVGCDVLAVVVLAGVVTATTSPAALLDTIVRPLRAVQRLPLLRRWVDAERVALTFSLAIASIPAITRCAAEAREAAAARGLGRSWRAFLIPTAVRTVGHAFAVADALTARGLGD